MQKNKLYISFIFVGHALRAYAMSNFVLMGPPGAGKGTFADLLVKEYGYIQICPGALLRAEAEKGTSLGLIIKADVENGKPIANSIVSQVVKCHVENAIKSNTPFVLDGFPKNKECFDFFIKLLKHHEISSRFIHLYATDNFCFDRIVSRLECHNCCSTFNFVSKQPQKQGICDVCQNKLVQRKGDDHKTALYRLQEYHLNIEPILKQIKETYMVTEIDTSSLSMACCKKVYENLIS